MIYEVRLDLPPSLLPTLPGPGDTARILSDGIQDRTPCHTTPETYCASACLLEAPQSHDFHFVHRELRHKLGRCGC